MIRRTLTVLLCAGALAPGAAAGLGHGHGPATRVPTLEAWSPYPGAVQLQWQNVPSDPFGRVVVFQNGYDTLRENTGSALVDPAPAPVDVVKVCGYAAAGQVCTNTVTVNDQ